MNRPTRAVGLMPLPPPGARRPGSSGCTGRAAGAELLGRRRRPGSCPSRSMAMRSAMRNADFMSWVMVTMVTGRCSRISRITCRSPPRSSGRARCWARRRAGSRAASAMARAKPTRRRMPPESSLVALLLDARRGGRAPGTRAPAPAISRLGHPGVAAQREGDVLEHVHRVEERALLERHAELAPDRQADWPGRRASRSSPSTTTWPRSGWMRPIRCLSSTLLPVPEPPTMTSDSPATTSRSTPRKHLLAAERLPEVDDGDLR